MEKYTKTNITYYINQINSNSYSKLTDQLFKYIYEEGWLEQLEQFYHININKNYFKYTILKLTDRDKNGLINLNKYNWKI